MRTKKIAFLTVQTVFLFAQRAPIGQLFYPKNMVVLTPQHRIPRPTKGAPLFVNDELHSGSFLKSVNTAQT
jgi:hypothetical protein